MLDVLERLQTREQDLRSALEHLETYKAQLEPVQEVFTQVETSVEAQAPVDLNKGEDELGKVDVSHIKDQNLLIKAWPECSCEWEI